MTHNLNNNADSTAGQARPARPVPLPVIPEHIPTELTTLNQWLIWNYFYKPDLGYWDKPPLDANRSGNAAKSTDPKTWATFDKALSSYHLGNLDGVGLAITEKNGIVTFDLDDCIDIVTDEIAPWALKIVEQVRTYWERSPSATGLRGFGKGRKPGSRCRTGAFELYTHGRYVTLTGHHLEGTPTTIEPVQDGIDTVYAEMFPPQARQASSNGDSPHHEDDVLLDSLRSWKNGPKFCRLFDDGDTSEYDGDDSRADQGLCRLIAFGTQDPEQIDRLFRISALHRSKWERADYREGTITKAIEFTSEHWRGVSAERNGQPHDDAGDERNASSISDEQGETPKPIIQLSTDMTAVVNKLERSIRTMPNAPRVFQRSRKLSVITSEVKPSDWFHRPPDAPAISPVEAAYLRELAAAAADWQRYDDRKKDGEKWVKTLPPEWAIKTLLARPYSHLPILEGLISAPTLRPDGSILNAPGYDAKTGLYACFHQEAFPSIIQQPTIDDARGSIDALLDLLQDFRFANPSHRAAALAAICSIVCRFAVVGCIPLFGVSATAAGSGKGLLVDAITISATGRSAPRWAQTSDNEEERKRLFAIAVEGDQVVHVDNVVQPLGSPALDMAITAGMVKERIMKTLTNDQARIYACFFASGNNLSYKGDLARRVVPLELDPEMERPEERTGFVYDPLLDVIQKRWPKLAVHALTIIRAFVVAGQPSQRVTPFGSFESWSKTIREALIWAQEPDPCEGRKDMRAENDIELDALRTLMVCWQDCYQQQSVSARKVVQDIKLYTTGDGITKWIDLQEALKTLSRSHQERLTSIHVGYVLRSYKGRVVGGQRFVRVSGDETHAGDWKLDVPQQRR